MAADAHDAGPSGAARQEGRHLMALLLMILARLKMVDRWRPMIY